MQKNDTTIQILGLEVFSRTRSELLKILEEKLLGSFPLQTIATPNAEQFVQARGNPEFHQALLQFEFLLPDGIGLVWASRVLSSNFASSRSSSQSIVERIAGSDAVVELLELAKRHDLKMLVLGGRGYAALQQNAAVELAPNLWWTPGFAEVKKPTVAEERAVQATLTQLQPTVVFVALGAPAQEFWIQSHREELAKADVRLAMAVGGSFDYLFGKVSRAPRTLQRLGLEWAYRLWQEPWRWRRQLRLLSFIKIVLGEWLRKRRGDR
jgi:N-acetylglucosaminyldiphosphoundecaprenol N-acetyl-beta-D-mannosaminyltransferase